MKFKIIGAIVTLAAIGGGAYWVLNGHVSDIQRADETVQALGAQMQNVSLLSPTVRNEMDARYAPYVTPQLLELWKEGLSQAPLRQTSSPWPVRIEISTTTQAYDGSYTVQGVVVEISSQEVAHGGVADTYPVVFSVRDFGGKWLIAGYSRGSYNTPPAQMGSVSIVGTVQCLPLKNSNAPNTLQCQLGLTQDATQAHFGLDLSPLNGSYSLVEGSHVIVRGLFVPLGQSATSTLKYNVLGIIQAQSIQTL